MEFEKVESEIKNIKDGNGKKMKEWKSGR